MKIKNTKSRRTFTIPLIIIGSIVIFGVLGFVVWQSFLKEMNTPYTMTNQNQETATDKPAVAILGIASDDTLGSGFNVTYPEGWTNIHTGAISPQSTTKIQTDENIITGPSGKVQVILKVQTNTQVGGPCSNSYIKLKHLEVDTTPTYSEGRFAAYVVYFPNTAVYLYHAGLQKNTEAIRGVSLTSNTACNFFYGEYIQRASSLPNVPLTTTLLFIKFVDLYNGNSLKSGVDELKVAEKLSGAEYDQAKAIVQSVYIQR